MGKKKDKRRRKALEHRLEEAVTRAEEAAAQARKAAKRVARMTRQPVRRTPGADLHAKTRTELMQMARERRIAGRSTMTKDELVEALR